MIGPVTEKLVILCGMFVATLTFGLLPVKLVGSSAREMRSKWRTVVTMSSCFSGGVFIAACLLDLFPDVREAIDHVLDEIEIRYHTKVDYPVAEFVIVLGFFMVLIVEQVVLNYRERWQEDNNAAGRVVPVQIQDDPNGNNEDLDTERSPLRLHGGQQRRRYGSAPEQQRGIETGNEDTASISGISSIDGGDHRHHEHDHHHDHVGGVFEHSTLRSVLLLIALSFHSLFEGLAIGLQQELGQLISLFIAVIVHKAIMAFSLGLTIAQAHITVKQYILANLIFSVSSPIGMGIGILLADLQQSLGRDIANGVLQGMAGGTFLYITFFEVLPHELNQPKNRMVKLLFVLLGYSSICGLLFITH